SGKSAQELKSGRYDSVTTILAPVTKGSARPSYAASTHEAVVALVVSPDFFFLLNVFFAKKITPGYCFFSYRSIRYIPTFSSCSSFLSFSSLFSVLRSTHVSLKKLK